MIPVSDATLSVFFLCVFSLRFFWFSDLFSISHWVDRIMLEIFYLIRPQGCGDPRRRWWADAQHSGDFDYFFANCV